MGCTASKLDNEYTVRRCKERRRLVKEAVQSRHHLASAHSDYLRSLLSTASALSRFAQGERLSVSEQTPPILLHHHSSSAASSLPPSTPLPHPPPPSPPPFSSSPSPTIASSKMPHILSDSTSSASSTPHSKPHPPPPPAVKLPRHPTVSSTYSTTPSQASSAWDWENFYPPSPPDSEFFNRIKEEREKEEHLQQHHLQEEGEEEEDEEEQEQDEEETREEIPCSEWGERHYSSSTTSSTKSDDEEEDKYSRSEFGGFAARSESMSRPPAPSEIGSSMRKAGWADNRSDTTGASSAGWTARDEVFTSAASVAGDLRMVVRHRDLVEIVAALEEYFVKAAGAGEQVSEILETGRDQLDRSFRQLKSKWESE